AMRDGGKLVIELAGVSLDDADAARRPEISPGQYILIALSDTGSGMPADIAARAFDPFFTTKPGGQGSGLGLSMVYGFVRQSGGHVGLLFTDVVMPGPVSSSSLVKAARDLQPAIKILFTSGYTQNTIGEHGRLEPGTKFLSKPYRKAQLAEMIRNVLAAEAV